MNEKVAELKSKIFSKKNIAIMVAILIVILLIIAAVVYIGKEPSRQVKKYFDLLTTQQYELSQEYLNKGISYFTVSYLNEENLNTHLSKYEYKVKSQEVGEDKAVVTLWVKRPDLTEAIKGYLTESIKNIFAQKTDEEIEKEKNQFFKSKFENNEVLMEETEVKINLTKLNNKWKIMNDTNLERTIFFGKTEDTSTEILNEQEIEEQAEDIYLKEYVQLKSYKVGNKTQYDNKKVPALSNIEFKNTGNRDVTSITVTVYFKDESGSNIAEDSVTVISTFDTPLRAGYSWKMEDDRYYQLENLSSDVVLSKNEVKITKITLAEEGEILDNGTEEAPTLDDEEVEKQEYIKNYLKLKKFKVGKTSKYSGKVPSLSKIEFKNTGKRDVTSITVTVYFKDAKGNYIAENSIRVIDSYDTPLKAGYSWKMEDYSYYELENLSSEVNINRHDVKITDIEFDE